MKSYSSREVIGILKKDGWYEVACVGDHHQFKHSIKKGRVTVTHPNKDIPIKTLELCFRNFSAHNGGVNYVKRPIFLCSCFFL